MSIQDFAERDSRPIEKSVYKEVNGESLRMLTCKPDGWTSGQRRPAMVWIHGGGWVAGEPESMAPHMRYSAARGALGIAIQYRLIHNPTYKNNPSLSESENADARAARYQAFIEGPSLRDCIDDCEDAIRYIRSNADALGVDPERILVIGDSAGAHLAACLGTVAPHAARANAVVACSSISDLSSGFGTDYVKSDTDKTSPDWTERAKALSPLFNITDTSPPFLILDGGKDWLKDEPTTFYRALQSAGVDCEYICYPEAKHAFIIYGYTATAEAITQAILDLDNFLLKRGLLEGDTSITMPTQVQ